MEKLDSLFPASWVKSKGFFFLQRVTFWISIVICKLLPIPRRASFCYCLKRKSLADAHENWRVPWKKKSQLIWYGKVDSHRTCQMTLHINRQTKTRETAARIVLEDDIFRAMTHQVQYMAIHCTLKWKNSIYVQTLDKTCTLRMTLKFSASTNENQRERERDLDQT